MKTRGMNAPLRASCCSVNFSRLPVACQVIPPPVFKEFPTLAALKRLVRCRLTGEPTTVVTSGGHVVNPKVSAGRRRVVQAWREPGGMSPVRRSRADRDHDLVRRLLELEQLSEQDGFVTAWATASQPDGMAKQPALCTTALAELTFAARRALVECVGD